MSASPAGKFQDHYAILGIDAKSNSETIQQAYSKLAQKYHPKNSTTGNAEMFEALNVAYEVLSDPELRSRFDELKGVGREEGTPKFSGVEFFDALGREATLRAAILCVLYDRRRTHPSAPSLSMRHLELIVESTAVELSSALWYLKQRSLAATDDKSSLQITVDGMDFLESRKPAPEEVMPFIKPEAIAAIQVQPTPAQPNATSAAKRESGSAVSALNRALARTST
jgi:curved DNA-binding protein CbpA